MAVTVAPHINPANRHAAVNVPLRNAQAAIVAPVPMPGRPVDVAMSPVTMPRPMPAAIAAGQNPTTAPDPRMAEMQAQMSAVNGANVAAAANFQEHNNAWDSAAQGFMNGQKFQEDSAKTKANMEAQAEYLGNNPDLKKAVADGIMPFETAAGIAKQRTDAATLETRKSKIIDYLKTSGDEDIAGQYASGVLDEDGVAKAIAEKDKVTKVTPTDEQRLLTQINAERTAAGKPEMSMEEFLASKKGTVPATDPAADLTDLPTVQLDEKGVPDPGQQKAFLSSLGTDEASLVEKIANYEMDITKVTSLKGGQRSQIAALVAQYDPTFDMNQYTTRARTKIAYSTGQQGQTIAAANTSIGHLGALYDDFTTMNNGGFVPGTIAANAWKSTMSDENLAKLKTNKQAVAGELAKFFKGSGASDMTTSQEWLAKFDENMGTDAAHAVITDVVEKLMKSRLDEMESQYKATMGRPADFRFLSPETNAVLEKMGIDGTKLDPNATVGEVKDAGTTDTPPTDTPPADGPPEAAPTAVVDQKAYDALPDGAPYTQPNDPTIYHKGKKA